jgi:hypothetical protein
MYYCIGGWLKIFSVTDLYHNIKILVRKDMDVNEQEILSNFTVRHKLK